MKVSQLDLASGYAHGAGPLALCLQRLNTLLHCPAVQWNDAQREAAAHDLSAALSIMDAEVLMLATRLYNLPPEERQRLIAATQRRGQGVAPCVCGPVRHWECNAACARVIGAPSRHERGTVAGASR